MDRSSKILIIVVIAIACLFVIVILYGVGKHRNEPTDPKTTKNFVAPRWVTNGLGKLSGSAIPKVELDPKKFLINPGRPVGPITIKSVLKNGPQFRKAKFHLTGGKKATIIYNDVTPDKPKDLSDKQTLVFPAPDDEPSRKDEPNRGEITVMRGGGDMTISCDPPVQCVLEVE